MLPALRLVLPRQGLMTGLSVGQGPRVDYLAHPGLGRLHTEIGDDPARTGLRPRPGIVAWRDVHNDVERITCRARFADIAGQLGKRRRAWQADWEHALPPQRALHRPPVWPHRAYPYRDPRPLHRNWLKLPGPVPRQIVETLIEEPGPLTWAGDFPERFQLAVPSLLR